MKSLILALMAATAFGGCGGGGTSGGGGVVTPPVSTPTPPSLQTHVKIAWYGAAHAVGLNADLRSPMDTASSPEPIEISETPPCNYLTDNSCHSLNSQSNESSASVQTSIVDANGSPVPAATPTVVIAAYATISAPNIASPAPYVNYYQVNSTVASQAQSTMTVTYPTVTATLPVKVFEFFGLVYPSIYQDSTEAYINQSGKLVATGDKTSADLYLSMDSAGLTFHAPLGFTALPSTTAIGNVTTALPFTNPSTSALLSSLSYGPVLIVALHGGGYAAIKVASSACSHTGAPSTCDAGGSLVGLQKVSDAAGNFSI